MIIKLKKEWKNILFNFVFAILSILIVIFFYKRIFLASILLLIVAIIGLIKWKSKITLAIFIFAGLFGTIAEMIVITYGVWIYSIKNIINVPLWLFILWGNAGAFMYQTAIEFKKIGIKEK